MSAITDVLDKLVDGGMTTDQVITAFATLPWVRPSRVGEHGSYAALAAVELEDVEDPPPGTAVEIADYYFRGDLTDEQYTVLSAAAASAINAIARPVPGTPEVTQVALAQSPSPAQAAAAAAGTEGPTG